MNFPCWVSLVSVSTSAIFTSRIWDSCAAVPRSAPWPMLSDRHLLRAGRAKRHWSVTQVMQVCLGPWLSILWENNELMCLHYASVLGLKATWKRGIECIGLCAVRHYIWFMHEFISLFHMLRWIAQMRWLHSTLLHALMPQRYKDNVTIMHAINIHVCFPASVSMLWKRLKSEYCQNGLIGPLC